MTKYALIIIFPFPYDIYIYIRKTNKRMSVTHNKTRKKSPYHILPQQQKSLLYYAIKREKDRRKNSKTKGHGEVNIFFVHYIFLHCEI
jgi:hypothetical protein